jgi:antitoxin FitA
MLSTRYKLGSILIRKVNEHLKRRLRLRAAKHGCSMEDEARNILRAALASEAQTRGNLYESIRKRIEPLGGVELPAFPDGPIPEPPKFDE